MEDLDTKIFSQPSIYLVFCEGVWRGKIFFCEYLAQASSFAKSRHPINHCSCVPEQFRVLEKLSIIKSSSFKKATYKICQTSNLRFLFTFGHKNLHIAVHKDNMILIMPIFNKKNSKKGFLYNTQNMCLLCCTLYSKANTYFGYCINLIRH